MAIIDYSYMGVGRVLMRPVGSQTALEEIGNCAALTFAASENSIKLKDFMAPGGGTRNEVRRVESVECSMTLHDLSPANIARAMFGASTAHDSSAITDEPVVAYLDAPYVPLARIAQTVTSVKQGAKVLVLGTDYQVVDGGLSIPAGSSITAPVAGAPNISVTYNAVPQDRVEALTRSAQDFEMLFLGMNEARNGKRVRVTAYRVKLGVAQALALISGDQHASLELKGTLQSDPSRTGSNLSGYFQVLIER